MKNHKLRKIKADSELPLLADMHTAARKLNICCRTIQNLVYQRRICFIKIGRFYKFRIKDLNDFINKNYIKNAGFNMHAVRHSQAQKRHVELIAEGKSDKGARRIAFY